MLILLASLALAACSTSESVTYDISPRAMAALPPDQDLSMVHRGTDGCYMYIKKGPLTGHLLPLTDETGDQICDDVRG